MGDLINDCAVDVHPLTVAAVIQVESAGDPLAIAPVVPRSMRGKLPLLKIQRGGTREDAITKAKFLRESGYSVSLGLMQINSMHYKRFNVDVEDMFDPCTNIKYGSLILSENYETAGRKFKDPDRRMLSTLSAYYTGKFSGSGAGARYGQKVLIAARKIANKVARPIFKNPLPDGITLAVPQDTGVPVVATQLLFPTTKKNRPVVERIDQGISHYPGDGHNHQYGTSEGINGGISHLESFCNGMCRLHLTSREEYESAKAAVATNNNTEETQDK